MMRRMERWVEDLMLQPGGPKEYDFLGFGPVKQKPIYAAIADYPDFPLQKAKAAAQLFGIDVVEVDFAQIETGVFGNYPPFPGTGPFPGTKIEA